MVIEMECTIREARIRSGLSLESAANALNISSRKLAKYEKKPSQLCPSLACDLADLYGLSINQLSFSDHYDV